MSNYVLTGVTHLEEESVTSSAEQFLADLETEVSELKLTTQEWSTCGEMQGQKSATEYVNSTLNDQTLSNLNLDAMLLFNKSGDKLLSAKFSDANQQNNADVLAAELLEDLLVHDSEGTKAGLVVVGDSLMIAAAAPILEEQNISFEGILVMGKYIDKLRLASISRAQGFSFSTCMLGEANMPQDFQAAYTSLSGGGKIFTNAFNNTNMAAYMLLDGVGGEPILIARINYYRSFYLLEEATVLYTFVSFAIIGLVASLLTSLLLEKIVLSRLSRLSRNVERLSTKSENLEHIPFSGHDEVSTLTRKINHMLDVIQKSRESLKDHAVKLEKKVEEKTKELRESQEKLRSILIASPGAIVATDLNSVIIECNEQAGKLHSCDRTDLMGKSASFFVSDNDKKKYQNYLKTIGKDGEIASFECTLKRLNGLEFPAEISISAIKDSESKSTGYVIISRDLTRKKQTEQLLFKSERLAAIGELAGMVGHDLRNPLTAIKNAAYYLKKTQDTRATPKEKEIFRLIDNSVEYSNKIINDLLDYSREIHLEPTECGVHTLIADTIAMIQVPEHITVIDQTCDEPTLSIDKNKMKRVFSNIIKNAFDAMAEAGTLSIDQTQNGDTIEITFSDSGSGISEEHLRLIFKPLFTTKAKGMGFGLSICKRIVEAHGGKIIVESTVGLGTKFGILLPASPKTMDKTLPADTLISETILVHA